MVEDTQLGGLCCVREREMAMIRSSAFGKVFGGLSVVAGAAQLVGIALVSTNSTAYAPFALLAFLVFPFVFGWKLYRLSRTA